MWVVPRGTIFSKGTRDAYGQCIASISALPTHVWWTSLPTWTPLVFFVAGLFHPHTVPQCQALLLCVATTLLSMAALVLWRAPYRSSMGNWLDATSRFCIACTAVCVCFAAVSNSRLNKTSSDGAFAWTLVLMVVSVGRTLHCLLCLYVDRRMDRELIPGAAVWTHITGGTRKATQHFRTVDLGFDELAAAQRVSLEFESVELMHQSSDGSCNSSNEGVQVNVEPTSSEGSTSDDGDIRGFGGKFQLEELLISEVLVSGSDEVLSPPPSDFSTSSSASRTQSGELLSTATSHVDSPVSSQSHSFSDSL